MDKGDKMNLSNEKLNKREKYRLEFLRRAKGEQMTYENLIAYNEASSGLSSIEVVCDDDVKDLQCNWLSRDKDEDGKLFFSPIDWVDKDEKTIVVKIHLDCKREDIIKGVEYLLSSLNKEAKESGIDFKKSKPHWEEYEKYLKAYDLKKEGKSWKKIAHELFPGDKSLDEGMSKVRHLYKRALKMINGGWRQI